MKIFVCSAVLGAVAILYSWTEIDFEDNTHGGASTVAIPATNDVDSEKWPGKSPPTGKPAPPFEVDVVFKNSPNPGEPLKFDLVTPTEAPGAIVRVSYRVVSVSDGRVVVTDTRVRVQEVASSQELMLPRGERLHLVVNVDVISEGRTVSKSRSFPIQVESSSVVLQEIDGTKIVESDGEILISMPSN